MPQRTFDTLSPFSYLPPPMVTRLLMIGSALVSVIAAFGIFATKVEANFYYDDSYYNRPTPCYQYDAYGQCMSSGTRYRARAVSNRYYNRPSYSYQYPYGHMNYGTNGYYRPVDNYYRSHQNRGCYWYYGSYRCDDTCN